MLSIAAGAVSPPKILYTNNQHYNAFLTHFKATAYDKLFVNNYTMRENIAVYMYNI